MCAPPHIYPAVRGNSTAACHNDSGKFGAARLATAKLLEWVRYFYDSWGSPLGDRGRILHHHALISELGTVANRGLHAGVCEEPGDDELVNAVFFELQIQIGVSETAGTPMFRGHDIAGARFELCSNP